MPRTRLFAAAALALSQGAFAQAPVGAGGQIQQIPPPPSREQRSIPEIRVQPGEVPPTPAADGVRFPVRTLHVTGQAIYSEAELVEIAGFRPGGDVSLGELRAMAARIAGFYHRNGLFVAQAYLPAQDIRDGAVTISVLEGHYGNVTLRNQTNLSDSLANGMMAGVRSGDTIAIAPLEESLLLLSDIPGVNVRSSLVPGTAVGTSDLLVDVAPGQRVTGSVEADNGGNYYTGEYRIGGTVNVNNPFGLGDMAGLRVLTSGNGMQYGRGFYQARIGKGTLGVAYTALNYELGKEFAALQAHGTSRIASLYGNYPLVRSRSTSLYAMAGYDDRTYVDKVDSTVPPTSVERKARVWMGGLYGSHRDALWGGAVNTFSLTLSAGDLDIRDPAARAVDAATARSNGSYGKLAFSGARLQNLTDTFSLYGAINGQFASKNLDISEKMGLGGPYAVRAYPVGEGYGDEGFYVNLEARWRLPRFSDRLPGQFHLIGFVDAGAVTLHKNPWAPGTNHRTLSGTGLGVTWADYNNFMVSAYWATRLGNSRALSAPDESSRLWLQVVKFF